MAVLPQPLTNAEVLAAGQPAPSTAGSGTAIACLVVPSSVNGAASSNSAMSLSVVAELYPECTTTCDTSDRATFGEPNVVIPAPTSTDAGLTAAPVLPTTQ